MRLKLIAIIFATATFATLPCPSFAQRVETLDLSKDRDDAIDLVEDEEDETPVEKCDVSLPGGGMASATRQAASRGYCRAAEALRRAQRLFMPLGRSLWCDDPGGARAARRVELERQAAALAFFRVPDSPGKDRIAERARAMESILQSDAEHRSISWGDRVCSSWGESSVNLIPHPVAEAHGSIVANGKRCGAFLVLMKNISGRNPGSSVHVIVGDDSCPSLSWGFDQGAVAALSSPEAAASRYGQILSSGWTGPEPSVPTFRFVPVAGQRTPPSRR